MNNVINKIQMDCSDCLETGVYFYTFDDLNFDCKKL